MRIGIPATEKTRMPLSIPTPSASEEREPRRLRACALDFFDRFRGPRRQHFGAGRGHEHVVLDADADATEFTRHDVLDGGRLRLLLFLEGTSRGGAETVAALPRLLLAVLA